MLTETENQSIHNNIIKLCDKAIAGNNTNDLLKKCGSVLYSDLNYEDRLEPMELHGMITSLVQKSMYGSPDDISRKRELDELRQTIINKSTKLHGIKNKNNDLNEGIVPNRKISFDNFNSTIAASNYMGQQNIKHSVDGNYILIYEGFKDNVRSCLSNISQLLGDVYEDHEVNDIDMEGFDDFIEENFGRGTTKPLSNKPYKTFGHKGYVKSGFNRSNDGFNYTINVNGKANFEFGVSNGQKYILAGGSKYTMSDLDFAKFAEMFISVSEKRPNGSLLL